MNRSADMMLLVRKPQRSHRNACTVYFIAFDGNMEVANNRRRYVQAWTSNFLSSMTFRIWKGVSRFDGCNGPNCLPKGAETNASCFLSPVTRFPLFQCDFRQQSQFLVVFCRNLCSSLCFPVIVHEAQGDKGNGSLFFLKDMTKTLIAFQAKQRPTKVWNDLLASW